MGDMLNTRPLDQPKAEIDYKPISAWAVAALTVSGIYVLYVGVVAATALHTGRPALSNDYLFALIGFVLSIMARAHIKRSEGTRVGLQYATLAWWLSIVGGGAFWAYNVASRIALREQAKDAATEWFDLLKTYGKDSKAGKPDSTVVVNQAFLLTQEPTRRQGIDPGNASALDANFGGGPLPAFRNSDLVRYFERNGEDISIKSLGVSTWEQIDAGYKLDFTFELRSPEGIANLNVILFGSEGKNIAGREWHIVMPQGGLTIQSSTTYGRLVQSLHDEARETAMTWMQLFTLKQNAEYYLLTLPAKDRAPLAAALDATRIALIKVAGMPVPPLTFTAFPKITLTPEEAKSGLAVFHALQARDFFAVGTVTDDKKNQLRDAFRVAMMMRGGESRLINLETAPQINVTSQEVRFTFPIDMALGGRTGGFCGGRLVLVSQSPQLVAELNDLYGKGKANPEAKIDEAQVSSIMQRYPREWRVARLETTLEPLQAPKQGPGAGMPMAGGGP
jgi:hypothetical protein